MKQAADLRRLRDLEGIGPATMRDFDELGVHNVSQLAKLDARKLYNRLCRIKGARIDPCCLDVFRCAVAQAGNPKLPAAQRKWWYWSRMRKALEARR
jgi:hypothetical protein